MGPDGAFITGSDFLMDGGVTAAYWFGELAPLSYKKLKTGLILDKKEFWDFLVDNTYKVKGNVQPLISLLKDNYYPHTDFFTFNSRYYHFAVAATIRNANTRSEMLSYLYKNSGHQGFLNIMRAYEVNNDKWMCLKLFEDFFGFCDFLVN